MLCRPRRTTGVLAALLLLSAFWAGCGGAPDDPAAPPDGWQASGDYWWREGVDTSAAFADLSSLEAMGLAESTTYAAAAGPMTDAQFATSVKRSIVAIYRHEPQVIDSVVEAAVLPEVQNMRDEGPEALRSRAYSLAREHVTEPSAALQVGEDVPVPYPDSLRASVGGAVRMQVRLDAEGAPQAVELLEGVHPTLDAIALRAATRMRWEPMRVDGEAIPSWVRFTVRFRQPPS